MSDVGLEDAVYDLYSMRRFLGLDFTFEQVLLRGEHYRTILDQISHVVRADDDDVDAGYQGAGKRADVVDDLHPSELDGDAGGCRLDVRETCLGRGWQCGGADCDGRESDDQRCADAHWSSLMVEVFIVDRLDVAIRQTCLCRPESNR